MQILPAANIGNYPVTFGEISSKQEAAQLASLENMKNELSKFDPASLPLSSQITYDILMDSINRSMALAPYYYYNELLSSTGGIQSEYPILLAEYAFHSVKDVEEYLTLLSKYDTFFSSYAALKKKKPNRDFL